MIILTASEANQVRGLTTKGHALAPRPLANGTFALPVAVLNDPAHASKWAFLNTLPILSPGSWSVDSLVNVANTYSPTWPEGQLITVG